MNVLRFLNSDGDVARAASGLLIQTGSPALLVRAVRTIRERCPRLELTVLRQRGMGEQVVHEPGVTYLDNEGSKVELMRQLRAQSFDVVFVLYSNEGGFWKLKLLPYFVGAANVLAYNENLDSFPVSLRTASQVVQHVRWRLESSMTKAPGSPPVFRSDLARFLLYPGVMMYLVGYERVLNATRRASGRADAWKSS
jgi:ADP-heptose:LPS heptosyltransferase